MSIILLALTFVFQEPSELRPTLIIDEESIPESEGYLTYPHDVLLHGDLVYVADQSHTVFVFSETGYAKKFGASGEGPGEFRHPPVRLEVVSGSMRITEMYGWSHSFFSLDGVFLSKEKIGQSDKYIGPWVLRDLPPAVAMTKKHRLESKGCLIGSTYGESDLDFHYSSFVYDSLADGTFFFVKRRGVIEIYNAECKLIKEVELSLARFAREPEYNDLFTQVSRSMYEQSVRRYYYGHPIYSVAAQNRRFLWMLVSNEHYEKPMERLQQVWLFRADLEQMRFDFSTRLPMSAYKIRASGGKLCLIYKEEATIHVFDIDELISSAGNTQEKYYAD